MQSTIVKCRNCEKENILSEMSSYCHRGITNYECANEKDCKSKTQINAELIEKKEKEDRIKYGHLPQEEQIKEKYGINFGELDELNIKFRDGSIHFYHKLTDSFYSWSWSGKYWYKPTFDLKKYV